MSRPVATNAALDLLDGRQAYNTDGELLGVVYYADETSRYYAVDADAISDLAERLARGDQDAYSRWCAEDGYAGAGHATEDDAAYAEGWIDEPEWRHELWSAVQRLR